MNESVITPNKFATRAGLILMAVPSIFWLGIILAVGFEKPVIVHEIMLPIDKLSTALTLIIMIGLPVITVLINFKAIAMPKYDEKFNTLFADVSYSKNKSQWHLIAYALTSIIVTLTISFFENFNFYAAILN